MNKKWALRRKVRRMRRRVEDKRSFDTDASFAWTNSGGNYERAQEIYRNKLELAGISPTTIILLIKVAMLVWEMLEHFNIFEVSGDQLTVMIGVDNE